MIGVIGSGAFGTALAIALSSDGTRVALWARDAAHAAAMAAERANGRRLPGHDFPATLNPTADLGDLADADALLLVVPAQQTAGFLARHRLPNAPLVLCAKGVSQDDGLLQTDLARGFGDLAVLTGPGFATEIAAGKPTALTLAAPDPLAQTLQPLLSRRLLRLYRSDDMTGAQLGGALKNVIAIAAGIAHGAGLGHSARAALITRGFAEMRRLARAMGARDETLAGLSGFGDLVLTCGSDTSRNFAFGAALGAGEAGALVTTEGIATARATIGLAARHRVEMPIAEAVVSVLDKTNTVAGAMGALLDRPLGKED